VKPKRHQAGPKKVEEVNDVMFFLTLVCLQSANETDREDDRQLLLTPVSMFDITT
jgi:hypothetical protein